MGRVDLFHSRRTNYHKCEYWIRDESNMAGSSSEWIVHNMVSGKFYAKQVRPLINRMNNIAGVWSVDMNETALFTEEDVDDLTRGSVVRFQGELWIVNSVQKTEHLKESEFRRKMDFSYTIEITRSFF